MKKETQGKVNVAIATFLGTGLLLTGIFTAVSSNTKPEKDYVPVNTQLPENMGLIISDAQVSEIEEPGLYRLTFGENAEGICSIKVGNPGIGSQMQLQSHQCNLVPQAAP